MDKLLLERILGKVQKPSRYTGGELNSVVKDKKSVSLRFAFCFPDTYEIGMSHLGMKILYSLINAREDAWCERVFAPWTDMEEAMRENGLPLYALESGDPVAGFDILGFTLQYELSYTNVLNMLDLAGLPVLAADREALAPLVIGGGPCACNAEPVADFFDLFVLGEGEEALPELLDLYNLHKQRGSTKAEFLRASARIQGVYVPSLYEVSYSPGGAVAAITPREGAPEKVRKRIIRDLDAAFAPEELVVPFIETVHDRVTVEVFRGCSRGCRFCQAGFIYRPVREKSATVADNQSRRLCENTGYDEISLCALSASDYSGLEELLDRLLDWSKDEMVNISLPSLRIDNFSAELLEKTGAVRQSGLTFAPEAGTQRLRDVINKNIGEHEVLAAVRKAFEGGKTSVKLYFMIGLPAETDEDIEGIAALAQKTVDEYYANPGKPKGRSVNVGVSVSTFVPKPFTPFQWEPQDTVETISRKQALLRNSVTTRKVSLNFHKAQPSFLEAVFARGDRRLSHVIETAWRNGCRFDGWDELFQFDVWLAAFDACGLDPAFYANRRREYDEILPWDHMDYGVSKAFLIRENKNAQAGVTTPGCLEHCAGCGANTLCGGDRCAF